MIFRDRDGKIIEEGQFFLDDGVNNTTVYHKICQVVEACSDRRLEVVYIGQGNRESITNPNYTPNHFSPYSAEQVKMDAEVLKTLSQGFQRAKESGLAQKAGSK